MNEIADTLGMLYRDEISTKSAEKRLAALGAPALAAFIVEAHDRDWISLENLGLDDDGNRI